MKCPNCGKRIKENAKKCPHCKTKIKDINSHKILFFDDKWEVVDLIGEGSFGKVYKAKKEEYGLTSYSAIKTINIPQNRSEIQELKNEGMDNEEICEYYQAFVKKWLDEIKLMQNLKSSLNVVNVEDYEVIEDNKKPSWNINIRMELLECIEDYYENKTITNKDILKMGIDIAKALEHCKKYNIIHRDIKPDNIFISELGDFKLGDFGIARNLEKTTSGLSKKGTYTYMAPEVYKGLEYNSTIDIYSLGLVLYKYYNGGRLPFLPAYPNKITFEDKENSIIRRMNGESIVKPINATDEEAKIILKMVAYDPKERYKNVSQLVNDLEKLYKEVELKNLIDDKTDKKNKTVKQDKTVSILDKNSKNDKTISILDESVKKDKMVSILDDNKTVAINNNYEEVNHHNKKTNQKRKLNKIIKILLGCLLLFVILSSTLFIYFKDNYNIVPDVVGMNSEEAIKRLEEFDFKEDIEEKEVDDNNVGKIIDQENKGEFLKKKSLIKLTLGVSSELVSMRNVVGMNIEDAKKTLNEIDIDVNVTETHDDNVPVGVVISQVNPEGEKIRRGSIVEVLVSKGKEEKTTSKEEKKTTKKSTTKKPTTKKPSSQSPTNNNTSSWSSWVESLPRDVNKTNYDIETKTQYRSRSKEFATDTKATKSGWTKYDQKVSYSAWSANQTSTKKVTASDTLDIVKTDSRVTSVTWYHYDNQYWNGSWGVDSIATWELSSTYHEVVAPIDANFGIYYDNDRGGKQMYSNGAYYCPGGWQVWFRGPEHKTTTYTYRTRSKTTTYYFYRFGAWSGWTDSEVKGNDNVQVETRELYRYKKK